MARLTLLLVLFGSAVASAANVPADTGGDVAEIGAASGPEEEGEITRYDEAIKDPFERRRREAPKIENSDVQFIKTEKKTEDKIFWRDNSETRKQSHVPTVTKVLYHGIYPSLNVTVPVNGSYVGKYRQTRQTRSTTTRDTRGQSVPESGVTVSTIESGGENEIHPKDPKDNMITEQNLATTRNTYSTPEYHSRAPPLHVGHRISGGDHYQKAYHEDPISDYNPVYDSQRPQYAQGSIRYRTKYNPKDTDYRGDPENKGHVRLISVGYYSVNESTADVRSYRNPAVNKSAVHSRTKRDVHWGWLDKVFKSIWLIKNPETDERENEIPGSEPLSLGVTEVNEEAQDVYGYSSNGHNPPNNVDRIYLVKANQEQTENHEPPSTITSAQSSQPTTISSMKSTTTPSPGFEEPRLPESEELSHPKDGPVLIQAPPRRIICRPPKRLARGRCRTVW